MYRIKYLTFIIMLLLILFPEHSSLGKTVSLKTLLNKVDQAIDPAGKLPELYTRSVEGEFSMPLQKFEGKVTVIFKIPDKLFIKTVLQDGKKVIQAYNGEIGWKLSSDAKKPVRLKGAELDSFRLGSYLEMVHGNWNKLFKKINLAKKIQKVDRYSCYKLTCMPRDEFHMDDPVVFYVDDRNFLIRKMELCVFSSVGKIPETIFVTKYQKFENILVAVETKTKILGADSFFKVTKVEFNNKVDDKIFDFSASIHK